MKSFFIRYLGQTHEQGKAENGEFKTKAEARIRVREDDKEDELMEIFEEEK